jgi:hypothetical protein
MVSLTLPLPQGLLKNVAVVPPFHQRYSLIEFFLNNRLQKAHEYKSFNAMADAS